MSNTLKIRRGPESTIPTLAVGELGFCTDSGKIYVGTSTGNFLVSRGDGAYLGISDKAADSELLDGHDSAYFSVSTHTHTFDSLTSKTSGTGTYSTSGTFQAGRGSGGVAMTVNDGYGNANLTFNHISGKAEQDGNAGRIVVNTDSTTNASMSFQLKSGLTAGTATSLTNIFWITESGGNITGNLSVSGIISEGGTSLSSKYLGISATATNADKTDGKHIWTGTQSSYDAITTKDSNTLYFIT